ncbi:MAG: class I tRNA ligase family protein, partial [Chloroflexi bacterium]|nr:class I tRNA ligase family protein [Chloroflexota bacterium]
PFVAEEIYQNLVRGADPAAPESVHMADWPSLDETLIDERILESTALAQRLVTLGRAARSKAAVKVRQPLPAALVKLRDGQEAHLLDAVLPQVAEELNVKEVRLLDGEASVLTYAIRPDLAKLGQRLGSQLPAARAALAAAEPGAVARAVGAGHSLDLPGFTLQPDEVLVDASDAPGYASAAEGGYRVAVATTLTEELRDEGMARELVHRLQGTRRNAGLDIADQIVTYYQAPAEIGRILQAHQAYIRQETLSTRLLSAPPPDSAFTERHTVDGHEVLFAVQRA